MLVRLDAERGAGLLETPTLTAHIGGAEANVAICVARLGGSAGMATVLPDNALGHAARDELRRQGVDISSVRFRPGRMGLYFLTPGAVLRPAEIIYDRAHSAFAEADPACINWQASLQGVEWFHVSGITPAVSALAGLAALNAAKTAAAAGVKVSFDGNYRSKLWETHGGNGRERLTQLLETATLAFIDQRDIGFLLGQDAGDPDASTAAAFEAFPGLQTIATTRREMLSTDEQTLGATLITRVGKHDHAPISMRGVVDRIGGGDAFAGGLLYALMDGMGEIEALSFALYTSIAKHGQRGDSSHASAAQVRILMAHKSLDIRR